MKKFLVLLIVFCLASMAHAGLVFTVNGEPQPPEITIAPSDIIELDLELEAGQTIAGYQLTYTLSNEQAELIHDGGTGSHPEIIEPMEDISFPWGSFMAGKVNSRDEDGICSWIEITASNFGNYSAGPLVLMQDMYLHCLEGTDVTLTISGVVDLDGATGIPVEHTLIVHQPEPMTVALLGLGGLFLRRRK